LSGRTAAVSVFVSPTVRLRVVGVTVTDSTGIVVSFSSMIEILLIDDVVSYTCTPICVKPGILLSIVENFKSVYPVVLGPGELMEPTCPLSDHQVLSALSAPIFPIPQPAVAVLP